MHPFIPSFIQLCIHSFLHLFNCAFIHGGVDDDGDDDYGDDDDDDDDDDDNDNDR